MDWPYEINILCKKETNLEKNKIKGKVQSVLKTQVKRSTGSEM